MPGSDAELVGVVSAVLKGSLTPMEIRWDVPHAWCLQLWMIYWSDYWNPNVGGIASEKPREQRTDTLASVL